jgi:hypothetical protein
MIWIRRTTFFTTLRTATLCSVHDFHDKTHKRAIPSTSTSRKRNLDIGRPRLRQRTKHDLNPFDRNLSAALRTRTIKQRSDHHADHARDTATF